MDYSTESVHQRWNSLFGEIGTLKDYLSYWKEYSTAVKRIDYIPKYPDGKWSFLSIQSL